MAKVTIEDISQLTGLSRGTISRALNDRPDISAQTKTKVLEACASLNYVPSHAARSLATGRHYALAVIVDNLQSAFSAGYLRGVLRRAERSHYTTAVVELPPQAERAIARLQTLSTERLDGILVAAPLTPEMSDALRESATGRTLASCWPIPALACDVLAPDMSESGRLAGLHALSGGGDVVYLNGSADRGAERRRAGFEAACRERGVNAEIALLPRTGANATPDFNALASALGSARAVVASDDSVALGAMLWLAHNGRWPGRDVAVIGQGNSPFGGDLTPTLTSIDFVGDEIGERAADAVLQRLSNGRQDMPVAADVAPLLRRRETSACLP